MKVMCDDEALLHAINVTRNRTPQLHGKLATTSSVVATLHKKSDNYHKLISIIQSLQMATVTKNNKILCLFDVDGTLTPARKVS